MAPLMEPAFDAGVALTRLDERIARSPIGPGFPERRNLRRRVIPTHELTIARDVLRNRWRFITQPPGWAHSPTACAPQVGRSTDNHF